MTRLGLLRGINVGGKNKVEMARLRDTFERLGGSDVRTYINTGNVIFDHDQPNADLVPRLEVAIAEDFGLDIRVLLRNLEAMTTLAVALPPTWVNGATMKCDVMFLWDEIDSPDVVDRLAIREDIDEVVYVPGALIWKVDRDLVTRSGMMKLAGTNVYKAMTVRNVNTVRKLVELMTVTE
ncbi:MAG TPA: DUF1697 domain-containing protein [Acidimicrobiia bacterium]|nr:DUF1697 domain-containing protein [Acidimicrobiia bacterium]